MMDLVKISGCELGPTYLRLPPNLKRDQWNAIAQRISQVGYGYWWWVGELANFATHNYDDGAIEELAKSIGQGTKYVKMIAYAAAKYPVRERVSALSISHHLVTVHLPHAKRKSLLTRAANNSWSVRELREHTARPESRTVLFTVRVLKADRDAAYRALKKVAATFDHGQVRVYGETRVLTTARRRLKQVRVLVGT